LECIPRTITVPKTNIISEEHRYELLKSTVHVHNVALVYSVFANASIPLVVNRGGFLEEGMRTFQARYPKSAFSKLVVDFKSSYLPFSVDDVGFGYSDAFGKGPPLGHEGQQSGWREGRVMKQKKMQRQRFGCEHPIVLAEEAFVRTARASPWWRG
jgi:hypothetical protein